MVTKLCRRLKPLWSSCRCLVVQVSRGTCRHLERLSGRWSIDLETAIPSEELNRSRVTASNPSFGFFLLLSCAAILATLGLIANSSAIIIGAMIIAPMMNPILSISYAGVTGNGALYRRSTITLALGILTTISLSATISAWLPIHVMGTEILSRTAPSILDLTIALVAGVAGSFSITRQSIANSIAGVAIAVALVPPLCVAGIGLGCGESMAGEMGSITISSMKMTSGALLLFMANLTSIILASTIVFVSQSYGRFRTALLTSLASILGVILLSVPLSNTMRELLISSRLKLELRRIRESHPGVSSFTEIRNVSVSYVHRRAIVQLAITAPVNTINEDYIKARKHDLLEALAPLGVESIQLNLTIIPVEMKRYGVWIQ